MARRAFALVFALLLAYLFSVDEWNGDAWSTAGQGGVAQFACLTRSQAGRGRDGVDVKSPRQEIRDSYSGAWHGTQVGVADDAARAAAQDNETLVFPPFVLVPVPVWCPIILTVEVAPAAPLEARGPPPARSTFPAAALRAPPLS